MMHLLITAGQSGRAPTRGALGAAAIRGLVIWDNFHFKEDIGMARERDESCEGAAPYISLYRSDKAASTRPADHCHSKPHPTQVVTLFFDECIPLSGN